MFRPTRVKKGPTPYQQLFPKPIFYVINRLIELDHLLFVLEQIDLVSARYKMGEPDANKPDKLPPLV